MSRNWVVPVLILAVLFGGVSSASASPPAKIISSAVSNVVSALVKWLWSLQSTPKTEVSGRSMMKFEGGYTVETVFDGSKLGIEPYSIEVSGDGELLVLDSDNSNIYKISIPLSSQKSKGVGGHGNRGCHLHSRGLRRPLSSPTIPIGGIAAVIEAPQAPIERTPNFGDSRPKLVAGSPEGYSGHVDGRAREGRLNHPKGLAVDDRGNIYIADAMNMAIRKISDLGISTIAGGKWGRGGGHVDGPSEDAKFSNDFDVFYVGISCSLMVVDRGDQAIREIQLHQDDCNSHEDGGSFHLGVAVLVAAGFFGYMLALLQQRVRAMFSSKNDLRAPIVKKTCSPMPPYQMPPKSVRAPFIPPEDDNESEETDDGLFISAAKLIINTGSSMAEIIAGLFTSSSRRTKARNYPRQETFFIPEEDEPPPMEPRGRAPHLKRTYPFTTYNEMERSETSGQIHAPGGNNWPVGDYRRPQPEVHQQQPLAQHRQQHHSRHFSSNPQTYYEKNCETNEVVFGAVQEQDGRREAMVIKAVDYGDPMYNHHNIRSRSINYMGYSNGY
ncbi:hypothetical protein CRG98_024514 [Punica granatum]|uniref:NHL domain-containing protein n=1 Tax=Punica granatum TaxID=22663 RepID=A0A2I0JGU8_PUNGR|nr:hypothetical protein CRG98_024514 [Punica granatum]